MSQAPLPVVARPPPETLVRCVHGDRCAGCPLLAMPYPAQLERKRGRVLTAFGRYPALAAVEVEEARPADPTTGYRVRAKWVFGPGGALGMYAQTGRHEVVDTPECRVVTTTIAGVAAALRALVGEARAAGEGAAWCASHDGKGPGALVAVDLRETDEGQGPRVLVTLVCDAALAPSPEQAGSFAETLAGRAPAVVGVALNYVARGATQILGRETRVVWGAAATGDHAGGVRIEATYGSFAQAHRGQATHLCERITALLGAVSGRRPRALDVYGGSGAFGLALAASGAEVLLVESLRSAADAAGRAARDAGLPLTPLSGDADPTLARLEAEKHRFDLVVVNPPRRGLTPAGRRSLSALTAGRLAYVSCCPETLARDLDDLARLGLRASSAAPLDMIPLTDEVETLVVLTPAPPTPLRVLYEDDAILVVDKPPHLPTTPQGEYARSLLEQVRRLPGAGEAVAVHRLDVGTSGACLFARRPSDAGAWSAALTDPGSQKTYLALVKGVSPPFGVIDAPLQEPGRVVAARTHYKRLQVAAGHGLWRVRPEQGRTHQIRRHARAAGHPVVGDARHGDPATNRHFFEKYGLDRTFLHCARLALVAPPGGRPLTVESPLPGDLATVAAALGIALGGPHGGRGRGPRKRR